MAYFFKNVSYLAILTGFLFACNPSKPIAQVNIGFEANFKGNGTAFYTIDATTGQLSYMVDFGEDAGNWRRYGNAYRKAGTSKLHFKAVERGDNIGSSFYILNGRTGQLSFMLDYGPGAGSWTGFGNPLRNVVVTEFETNFSVQGMIFYVYDGIEKKMHFMQDYGENAGKWQEYGKDKN